MNFLNAGVSPGERAYAAIAPFLTRQKGWKKRQGKMWGHKAPSMSTLWCKRWCRFTPYIVSHFCLTRGGKTPRIALLGLAEFPP